MNLYILIVSSDFARSVVLFFNNNVFQKIVENRKTLSVSKEARTKSTFTLPFSIILVR